jgi:wyosine [tRNA(Phe)-imidazoG37] synthetase (radical SAM superfamily)
LLIAKKDGGFFPSLAGDAMKYLYGPLKSRRLGMSLGISLTPYKTCSFDCVYCQLGKTTQLTAKRDEYILVKEVLDELKSWCAQNSAEIQNLDYITFSGAGEPTLNIKIGQLIAEIRKLTTVPIAVITNSAFLNDPLVRQALCDVDLIVPSLDAVTQDVFEKIDRPDPSVKIEEIIEGLVNLRKEFSGKIWLEVMCVKGINDDIRQVKKLKAVIDRIHPDKIQLNSPVRVPVEPGVKAVARVKLEKFKEILGEKAEIL